MNNIFCLLLNQYKTDGAGIVMKTHIEEEVYYPRNRSSGVEGIPHYTVQNMLIYYNKSL